MRINYLAGLILLVIALGCRRYNTQQPEQDTNTSKRRHQEALIRANRQLVDQDAITVEAYIKQKGWQMHRTESGLWHMVYRQGKGEKTAQGKVAILNYNLSLLNDTVCYSSANLGVKEFRLGRGGVESGLEEGLLLLRVGDKARFIMPPHLAYGLTGDGNCIPPRAIILYDVELTGLK
jgi:FKBP-type peptidyl-prolyl cis-trans isomerase